MDFIISFVNGLANAGKRLLPYVFYNFVFFIFYLLTISIFSFFHFILGHEFNLIEIWVQENIWIMLIFSKLTSFFLFYQYYKAQNLGDSLIHQYFIRPFHYPPRVLYVVLIFLLFFSIIRFDPHFNEKWSSLSMVIHFIGHVLYFGTDFLVVSYLMQRRRISSQGDSILTLCLASFYFTVLSYIIISSKDNFSLFFTFEFFLMIFFYDKYRSWIASVWVLLLFTVFLNTLLGLDMFYEENIGLFYCREGGRFQHILVAFVIILLYLRWRPRFVLPGKLK